MMSRHLPKPPRLPPKRNSELLWLRWPVAGGLVAGILFGLAKCAPLFRAAM